ncbi:MAG TPA: toll/interleukin-1 receptor domain-containing protein [Thermoanaerobaculia bacterium]|jgi:hypothetical protein
MNKVFFTSYARDDNADDSLGRTINKLKERVSANLGLTKEDIDKVVFFDTTDIQTGKEWEEKLGEALRLIRVLVCMVSPRYLSREYCAKEFEVFRRRLDLAGEKMKDKVAIIPVIWERGAPLMVLPQVINTYQWRDDRFPKSYGLSGLAALQRLRSQKEQYRKTIEVLAEVIGNAYSQSALVEYPKPVKFDDLPNWFHNPRPGPYNVTLTVLHANRSQWKPMLGGRTIGGVLDAVAISVKFAWEEIQPDLMLRQRLVEASQQRQVSIIVVERDLVAVSPWKEYLAEVIAAGTSSNCAVVFGLPPNLSGVAATPLNSELSALLPAGGGPVVDWFYTDDLKSLENALTRAITGLRMVLLAADPGQKVENPELSEAAQREGIPVDVRPMVTGPGGAAA